MLTQYSGLILALLNHSPVLTSITVTFTFTPVKPDDFAAQCAPLMAAVDIALAVHTARPSIRCRLRVDLDGKPFVDVVALIQAAMPHSYGSGRLTSETYCLQST
ncbi:hypothetical protein C8R46DRAFT_1114269 [Mycena filopes]|nr:hypothetical protein C8R46DRAFT_1114269 [Mycena filopes]